MFITFSADYFASETEARQEIEQAGLWPLKKAIPPTQNETHWHAYDAHVYILDGELHLTDAATGQTYTCPQGSKIVVPARELHSETHDGYTGLIGMSVDPAQLSQPTLRRPEELNTPNP